MSISLAVTGPTTFTTSIDIAAPPGRVWEVMKDVERWHEWTASITSVKLLGSGPLAVGKRAFIRQPKVPPALWRVTELVEGSHFVWRAGMPGMWTHGFHTVEPVAGGTRATLRLDYRGLLGPLMARLTTPINDPYLALEAAGLKARSELP